MKQEHVAWGAASMLFKRHGADAPLIVASRIGELATIGDNDGITMWKAIAACLDQMMRLSDGATH
ncbi:DUF6961 family protein [Sphingobium yanoikuyae]|uniref:DUF6961 family protein n=1 Tax=Sphingobium yanoikuyae TaxID=13690 RepID=UPI001376EF06|nr:hypothetical protein [Sphingobium yanoikuyae]